MVTIASIQDEILDNPNDFSPNDIVEIIIYNTKTGEERGYSMNITGLMRT
jgi:hypothetical protein